MFGMKSDSPRSSDILPPLMLTHRSGGFLFDSPDGLSISRLTGFVK